MNHAEYEALADAYVLAALEPDEDELFCRHLRGCLGCQATVRELEGAVADIAAMVPRQPAPRALRRTLVRSAGLDQPGHRLNRPAGVPTANEASRSSTLTRLGLVLSFVAILGLGACNVVLRNQQAATNQQMGGLAALGTEVGMAGARVNQLHAGPGLPGVKGSVVWVPGQQHALLVINGPLPSLYQELYQVWLLPSSKTKATVPLPSTVFTARTGQEVVSFQLPAGTPSSHGSLGIEVTLVPGPVDHPTVPPVLIGTLSG